MQVDADGNGLPDDPVKLAAAFSAGQYAVLSGFHQLVPNAYISGHAPSSPDAAMLRFFNGNSLEVLPQNVRENAGSFANLLGFYQTWESMAVAPRITNIQASPPNQLSYGYGYDSLAVLLPATAAFAEASYANMRFGLALTLMQDGYFTFDFGDAGPPQTWWYDEFDFNLGYPINSASRIPSANPPTNLIANGGFEDGIGAGWKLSVANDGGKATVSSDSSIVAEGSLSAKVTVTTTSTAGHITWEQGNLPLTAGATYQVQFLARADTPRTVKVFSQGSAPPFPVYGLNFDAALDTGWRLYTTVFKASATASDARFAFWLGDMAGSVWIDGVQLISPPPNDVYRRDFTNGVVLLNGTATPQTIPLEPGLSSFSGTQAPLYQYMVDDADTSFVSNGAWRTVTINTGSYGPALPNLPSMPQNANGPYFHAWQGSLHELDSGPGDASWNLSIPADGQYTVQVWLPAAPTAGSWTRSAVYEVLAGGNVIVSATIDQTSASAGDGLHMVAAGLTLTASSAPVLRVRNTGTGSLIADAVYVTSAALYNDGSPAPQVTLGAFDGILLKRSQPVTAVPPSRVDAVMNAANFAPAISSGGFVSIVGDGFGTISRTWAGGDFVGNNLPLSLDGISATINGKAAYVEYISPSFLNVIAPDDDTLGTVTVQVKTQQGLSFAGTAFKQRIAPAFFAYSSNSKLYVAATHLDGSLVSPQSPAVVGESIELYGTGFGPTTPVIPTGVAGFDPAPLVATTAVSIGGVPAVFFRRSRRAGTVSTERSRTGGGGWR